MPTGPFRPLLLVLLMVAAAAVDRIEADEWFIGELAGQPAVSVHQTATRHGDGRRTTRTEMVLAIVRRIPGAGPGKDVRFELRDTQVFVEDPAGAVASFQFDRDENGSRTTAQGTVAGGRVSGAVLRLGRSAAIDLALGEGVEILGDRAMQERMTRLAEEEGQRLGFTSLVLTDGQVLPVATTAILRGSDDQGRLLFDVSTDLLPITTRYVMSVKGGLAGMSLSLLGMALEIRPHPGPVALLGAPLSPAGLVMAAGAPGDGDRNRLRLPEGVVLPDDPFQSQRDGVVEVLARSEPEPLDDPRPFLQAEPSLELDDPALRAWVDSVVIEERGDRQAMAERLRAAVRSHISGAGFDLGDASALETFRRRKGDCTEHANLLCAALRIAGIPARVEVGLVYLADQASWCGHAWNSAHVGGRWIHLDSALPGIPRSRYLKLATVTGGTVRDTRGRLVGLLGELAGRTIVALPAAGE